MYRRILPLSVVMLMFLSCQGGGGYRDMAMITDAERNLKGIRNALEEYWVDHGTYPEESTDLEVALRPYFLKVRFKENKDAPLHSANIDNASNQLEKATNLIANVRRQVEPLLDSSSQEVLVSHIENIENLISQYGFSLEAGELSSVDIKADEEFDIIIGLLKSMNPDSLILKIEDDLIDKGKETIHSLLIFGGMLLEFEFDTLRKSDVIYKVDAISETFKVYEATLTHQTFAQTQVVLPEREIGDIEAILSETELDEKQIQILEDVKQNINQYRSLEIQKEDAAILQKGIQSLKRAKAIIAIYEKTMIKVVQVSAIILRANITLRQMANSIEDYRRKYGSYPSQDIDLDSLLHPYFIEVTMGGDTIDRYEEALSSLIELPSYYAPDPVAGFELRAEVPNVSKTQVFCRAEIISDWDNVLSSFSEEPVYRTMKPELTYFISVRAKDSRNTLISERSPIREK